MILINFHAIFLRRCPIRLLLALAMLVLAGRPSPGMSADPTSAPETNASPVFSDDVVFFDLTYLFKLDLNDDRQRRRFWDEAQLVTALEGLVNRQHAQLFVRYLKAPDDFWWEQMTRPGGWLARRKIVRINNLDALLERFHAFYHGAVVWDERIPATANLAATMAGCDDLLPLRFDSREDSLYRQMTGTNGALSVKARLLREDGSQLFTGVGMVPDTGLPSSGSAKCDAYLWLIEKYVRTGKANPLCLGYYLDSFWLNCWKASEPENNTVCNQDFIIARKGVLFDLGIWDDEAPVDDPQQRPGTDPATLRKLLRAAYDAFHGKGIIQVAGFIPWAYKYTAQRSPSWFAGGHHEGVPTEWHYAEILSCFNACMDADALGLSALPNASFYQHYPLAAHYQQNPKPTRNSLMAKGLLDPQGRILPAIYVGFYVGDYDSAAWLYHMLPGFWADPARGTTPLSWAFNPNLCGRFPLGMVWARESRTANDWFVAGDSGAGYINPGYLTPPRPQSGLPSGLSAWEQHCHQLYQQWDISLTGFVIDGFARPLSSEGLDAYARFSPDGIITDRITRQGVHQNMPYLPMRASLDGSPEQAAQAILQLAGSSPPFFVAIRSTLKSPAWHAQVEQELHRRPGENVKVVDLYSLLWLVHEYETNAAARPTTTAHGPGEIFATPTGSHGLTPITVGDGSFTVVDHDGMPCWKIAAHSPPYYVYFSVDHAFRPQPGGALQIELEFLDTGLGDIVLEYDSADLRAPLNGSYKKHPLVIHRSGTAHWQKVIFNLVDARFVGSQNGHADFRFYNGGDDLFIRSIHIRRTSR